MENTTMNLPMSLNCVQIENLNTIFRLEEYTIFKEDITSLNKSKFEENGIMIINEEYIRIENMYFLQNFPYSIIKEIKSTRDKTPIWNIILNNNETITLHFNSTDNRIIKESEKFINQKINNRQINNRNPMNIQNQSNIHKYPIQH